jgi:hypothetical protein
MGGRARTLKKGPPIDLGGAWLHGVATNQLTGIVGTMGFKRVTTRLEQPFFTEQGRVDSERSRAFWAINELFENVLGQAARSPDSAGLQMEGEGKLPARDELARPLPCTSTG